VDARSRDAEKDRNQSRLTNDSNVRISDIAQISANGRS